MISTFSDGAGLSLTGECRLGDEKDEPNIAIVDADVSLGLELHRQLKHFDYESHWFPNLLEAASSGARLDLAIVDADQCVEGGRLYGNAASWLSDLHCPYLFMSRDGGFDMRVQASRLGGKGFFTKPLSTPRLVQHMHHLLKFRLNEPERVLLVLGERHGALRYERVMQSAGMQTQVLRQPQALIETLGSFKPELVLLDLYFPPYQGAELAGVIRQFDRWKSLPLLLITQASDPPMRVQARLSGIDDLLHKHASNEELLAMTRSWVQRVRDKDMYLHRDNLTGLLKHSAIKEILDFEVLRAARHEYPVSVVMVDIDKFKDVNDVHGHAIGDEVISTLGTLLSQNIRQSDVVGRYGGEEFVLILPNCDLTSAERLMEKILSRFSSSTFHSCKEDFTCTFSAGVACSNEHAVSSGSSLLALADAMMYVAKRSGRNCVRSELTASVIVSEHLDVMGGEEL